MVEVRRAQFSISLLLLCVLAACGGGSTNDAGPDGPSVDAGVPDTGPGMDLGVDFGPPMVASTAHCTYEAAPPTARAGGTVTDGAIQAGVADRVFDIPVGTSLGGYTARAVMIGGLAHQVDHRLVEQAGGGQGFNPSIGMETLPHVHALALTAGDETVIILRTDFIFAYDGFVAEIERGLGHDFDGKVIFASSHSHAMFEQYTGNTALAIGGGAFRRAVFDEIVSTSIEAAQAALAARAPAKIGFAHDGDFDPMDLVNHDRRGENDRLPGGNHRKDHDLFVTRVDTAAGAPLAVIAIFGIHGTVMDADSPLTSAEAPGYVERAIEESFDSNVLVMHLQGAAGDVSPSGSGGLHITSGPGYNFPRLETIGLYARDAIMAAWTSAGSTMVDHTKMEMVTRSIPLGPDWATFDLRHGAMVYAPFNLHRRADRMIWTVDGGTDVISPIDEFNAPVGAALCGDGMTGAIGGTAALMPGTSNLSPYFSCSRIDGVAPVLALEVSLNFEGFPLCASTRSTVSALRIGDQLFITLPGEPVGIIQDYLRNHAPAPFDAEHTAMIGYAQGHIGYILTPEDWVQGGYEPSINFWGPLEGEYLADRALEVAQLVTTDAREDGQMAGVQRWVTPATNNDSIVVPPPDAVPAAELGHVPAAVPATVYTIDGHAPAQAQPVSTVARLGTVTFTWTGEDPMAGTPRVVLQKETSTPGTFADVTRRSGRPVTEGDFLMTWTPDPLVRVAGSPRTHYWVVEWQAAGVRGTAAGLQDLVERQRLPLGTYRFHVTGTGYTLDSGTFAVTPAAIQVGAMRTGTSVALTLQVDGTGGFRLLDMLHDSNALVPLLTGPVTVELRMGATSLATLTAVTVAADGSATVTDASVTTADTVVVTDSAGNTGTASL